MRRGKHVCRLRPPALHASGFKFPARPLVATLVPMQTPSAFQPPVRLLMGPGPSNVAPSVLQAMAAPLLGHLDPLFVKMMEDIKTMLRLVFLTKNEMTFPVS